MGRVEVGQSGAVPKATFRIYVPCSRKIKSGYRSDSIAAVCDTVIALGLLFYSS